jgi:hypothetical protein
MIILNLKRDEAGNVESADIRLSDLSEFEAFKQALVRACAHWQDAPPEILLLKRKLCGDPILKPTISFPDPKDFNFLAPN